MNYAYWMSERRRGGKKEDREERDYETERKMRIKDDTGWENSADRKHAGSVKKEE